MPTATDGPAPRATPTEGCDRTWSPTPVWTRELTDPDGSVVVHDATLVLANGFGNVHALALDTGRVLWGNRVADDHGRVVGAAGGHFQAAFPGARVVGLDPDTGDVAWRFGPPGEYAAVSTDAATSGRRLFVGAWQRRPTETDESVTAYDRVYALAGATGDVEWTADLEGDGRPAALATAGGRAYVATEGGVVYGVDASSGAVDWRTRVSRSRSAHAVSLTTRDDAVFATFSGDLAAVSGDDGRVRWLRQRTCEAPPTVAGGSIYCGHEATLTAYDRETRRVRWSHTFPGDRSKVNDAAVAAGVAYVAATVRGTPEIHAFDAADGCHLGRFVRDVGVRSPTVVEGRVYVPGDSGVYALPQA